MAEKSKAIVVGVQDNKAEEDVVVEELNELRSLLRTLEIDVAASVMQKRARLSSSHLIGTGKAETVRQLAEEHCAEFVVVDHPLTGLQTRNLEKLTGCTVTDRSGIILEIFANHAQTKQAKTQVEIARLEYLLPRLQGAWTHFQKQAGAGMHGRGMGEKQIEIDRRRARERISRLQKKLERMDKEQKTQSKKRQNELKVAIVGYTNSGKTTVMHGLTAATTPGKNELFATLDSKVKTLDPNTRPKILLSDTVGFIRKLPHSLVASFKSTLAEVIDADVLLHIVDVSNNYYEMQMETTHEVLEEIGAHQIPEIIVFNKTDQLQDTLRMKLLKRSYPNSIALSAFSQQDIVELRNFIYQYFATQFEEILASMASDDLEGLSLIHNNCVISSANYEVPGLVTFKIRAPKALMKQLKTHFIEGQYGS